MEQKEIGNCIVAYPTGRLDITMVPKLETDLKDIIALHRSKHLILNLQGVDYVSSSGLGVFVVVRRQLEKSNRSVRFCHVSAHLKRVIEALDMAQYFHIYESESEAMAAVS